MTRIPGLIDCHTQLADGPENNRDPGFHVPEERIPEILWGKSCGHPAIAAVDSSLVVSRYGLLPCLPLHDLAIFGQLSGVAVIKISLVRGHRQMSHPAKNPVL